MFGLVEMRIASNNKDIKVLMTVVPSPDSHGGCRPNVQGLILGSFLRLASLGKAGQSGMKVEMCSLGWHSLTGCY